MKLRDLGKLKTKKIDISWCPYCRKAIRGQVFYWDSEPRLYFESEACAHSWAIDRKDQNGVAITDEPRGFWNRVKRAFSDS